MFAPQFQPADYGSAVSKLLAPQRMPELKIGPPNQAVRTSLQRLSIEEIFAGRSVLDRQMGAACQAGLWLYHDYFDESHNISQEIHTPTGSFWHGILHRREPDYGNAKYWFRQVGFHPVYEPLLAAARQLAGEIDPDPVSGAFAQQERWDPYVFVDLCQQAAQGSRAQLASLCRSIQLREWELLFEFCYREAIECA